ncbi:MAG TPA: META domain-containing protein [Candidatus Limnocylindrales bacterium]|nr:META domain-containing protein [Candidatus Limnocylindrales bacterium]
MRLHRTTTALAALLMVGSLGACAEYTTTGVPADEEAAAEEVMMEEGNPLEATSWALTESSLSSQDLTTMGVTADFLTDEMSGQAPVNRYFAEYTVEGESIEFGEIGQTLMAGDPELMTAESAYFELLGTVTSFEFAGDTLVLKAGEQEVLTYATTTAVGAASAGGASDINALAGTLVGMSVADAEKATTDAGFTFRVVSEDGEPKPVTMDYREDRINAEVEDDEVVRVTIG